MGGQEWGRHELQYKPVPAPRGRVMQLGPIILRLSTVVFFRPRRRWTTSLHPLQGLMVSYAVVVVLAIASFMKRLPWPWVESPSRW